MTTVALIFSALAAAVHVAIFALETLLWHRPAVKRLFGAPRDHDTPVLNMVMFNQGFYNLFLALGAIGGIVAVAADESPWLLVFCLAFMVAAALVLVLRSAWMWRGALIQGAPALLALAFAVTTGAAA